MLTKLSLKNVKSFDSESNLNLAPITLIYGPNSSGKSTLWKFLVTLRDSPSFKGYGQSFLNFNRSDDFANARTISFDPKEASSFGLGFFGGRKIYHDDLSKWLNKNPESSCKWCVYIRVRKKNKDQLLLMFKTNHKPLTKFTSNSGNIVTESKKML